jgi:hypothetical protein
VLVSPKLTFIKLNGIQREDRFRVEGRASHALTKCAVANKRSHWRLIGTESNLATEAATFKYDGHDVEAPICVMVNGVICDA